MKQVTRHGKISIPPQLDKIELSWEYSWIVRYFHGVQDDKSKRGELFGLENIFKLQEDELATKMAVRPFVV